MIIGHGRTVLDNISQKNELLDACSWRLLLPDLDSPRVLSIMPPDALHLDALATVFGNVTSLESRDSPITCENASETEGREGIRQVRGSVLSLPFSDESFDLVVVNAFDISHDGQTEPANWPTRHKAILGSLRRVLATDGCACLCAPNRWDYRQLLEGNDQDPRGPSGKLRSLVRTYRRLSSQFLSPKRYLTVLHEAGFSELQAYIAFPDCRMPRFVVPFDTGVYRYYRRHFTYPQGTGLRKMLAKLIASSGQDRFVESHLMITGVKS